MSHAHPHVHVGPRPTRASQRRALAIALGANGVFMVVEVVGGLAFGSLALLADAGHMASDVAALAIALTAQRLMERPASARHTYGLQRVEVLGALANALLLVAVAAWVVFEAVGRLDDPAEVEGGGLLIVAAVGLAVNVVSAIMLARRAGASLNMRGATLHMMLDAAGSVAAVLAGIAVLVWDEPRADPLASLAIAALILWSGWVLLRQTVHVLLEGTPRGMDSEEVERAISRDGAVEDVHHLHTWNIASDVPALSAHVVLKGEVTLHEAQEHGDRIKGMLATTFGIEHATLELECHSCEPEATGITSPEA
ncbi:MAG: cation diffusion facilitator family transporter [Actinomycetota bacterium]